MEFSTDNLKPLAQQLAGMVSAELINAEEDVTVRDFETDLRRRLQEVGRLTLGQVLSQADVDPERSIACACGGTLHYQRRRSARVLSVFGWVDYERAYYAGCVCKEGKAPLDEKLGLEPGQVTAGLATLLGMAGVELAFEYSSRWLEPFLLFEVSENTIRKETQCFGELQAAREAELVEQSQDTAYLQERVRTETAPSARVYGSLDGAHVRIEEREQRTQVENPSENEQNQPVEAGKPPAGEDKWREMKVGCWYTVESVPPSQQRKRHRKKEEIGQQAFRARDMHYFCDITDAGQFDPLFWATGCHPVPKVLGREARAELAQEVVFVCDGARWIWNLVERNYPHAVQIVDWHHAEARLEKVARDALTGEHARSWLEETRDALWEGDTRFVVAACEKLATNSSEAQQALTYFRNNSHRMRYPVQPPGLGDHYRAQGYMIGSGTVESACKQIVTRRLKCSGAQWNLQGAVQTAKARAAWLSGEWDSLSTLRDRLPLAV